MVAAAMQGGESAPSSGRACGTCSLCCVVLRVDELAKPGGTPCPMLASGGGCSIHPRRPGICRAYRCLWLRGGLGEKDRPDRLGAVLDVVPRGGDVMLAIRESEAGAFERSPRLREIAEQYRRTMPVRISEAGDVMDPDRPFRVLLPDGTEQRVCGERVAFYRGGERVGERRMPWLERWMRRLAIRVQRHRLRRAEGRSPFARDARR